MAKTANKSGKELGLPELIAIGVGGMIGGGIFSVLGLAVDIAGHAAPLAFSLGSIIALVAGYSYIKLALAYRSDGASFTYLERAFPTRPAVAGIAGYSVVVGYIGTLSLYAFTFGAYSAHLFGWAGSGGARMLLSLAVLGLFTAINLIGAKSMGRAEDIIVYVKVILLAVLAIVGFTTIDTSRMVPLINKGTASVFMGGALIFVAYEGFQLITNAVVETKNPARNLPLGIYGSIIITSIIYIAIAIISVGNLDVSALHAAQEYALAVVAKPVLGRTGVVLVDIAAMLATSSAINATLFGAARMADQMATDTLAPKAFSIRNRHKVPARGVLMIAGLAALLTVFGGLELIASFSSMTFLLVSIAVTIANLKLRSRTNSRLIPVLLGLILMGVTVTLLIVYLAMHDPAALGVTAGIYLLAMLSYFFFEFLRHRSNGT